MLRSILAGAVCIFTGAATVAQETDTPVTIERAEGPLVDLEVFGEDGPFHVWQQDIVVTIRTVEGRPLTRQEKDESLAVAVTCPNQSQAFGISEGETADGAFVVSFTCE